MDEAYRRALSRIKPLSRAEKVELHRRMRAGDLAARDRLVESVLKWVYEIAKKCLNSRLDVDDFVAEGNYHAIRAVEAWEPSKGELSTIVSTYVRNGVHRFTIEHGHAGIFIPLKTYHDIQDDTPKERTPARRQQLENAKAASYIAPFSTLPKKHGNRAWDVAQDREHGEPEGFCLADVEPLLRKFATPLERRIFRLKYGAGDKKTTFEHISAILGVPADECRSMMRKLIHRLNREAECKFCGDGFVRNAKSKRYCSKRCHRLSQKLINAKHHREARRRKQMDRHKPIAV